MANTGRWTVALLAALSAGCGGEVVLGPGNEALGPDPRPGCVGDDALQLDVRHAQSGAFVGGYLHLVADLEGTQSYMVIGLSEDGAYLAGSPDLDGPANLVALREGMHGRIAGTERSGWRAEAIDTSDPAAPAIAASVALEGVIDGSYGQVFSAAGERLLFCMREPSSGVDERYLHVLDVSDLAAPRVHGAAGNGCGRDAGAAFGAVWMSWNDESDAWLELTSAQGGVPVGDYLYAPDGIHQYGAVEHAASDSTLAVFDPESESEFFLFSLPAEGGQALFNHATIGGGEKRLLDVRGGAIYLATANGVRAYVVDAFATAGEWAELSAHDFHAEIPLGAGLAEPIAADDRRLLVQDDAGQLYLIDRSTSGPVAPLAVYDAPCNGDDDGS